MKSRRLMGPYPRPTKTIYHIVDRVRAALLRANPASVFLADFYDGCFSSRADAEEDRLVKFSITDASIRMNNAALATLLSLTAGLSVYRLHLRHLALQTLQER